MQYWLSLVICLLLASCAAVTKSTSPSKGHALLKLMRYDEEKQEFVTYRELRYRYSDSMVIVERDKLTMITDHRTGEKRDSVSIIGYTFVDLRTKSFYLYGHFSDTAQPERSYQQPAEGRPEGGWNFFQKPQPANAQRVALPDTLIGETVYKRFKSYQLSSTDNRDTAYWEVKYFDCKSGTPFLFVGLEEGQPTGCVMTMYESYIIKNRWWLINKMKTVSNKLSEDEEKVFVAWKKNAERSPVK